jgi:hypothetical protein
MKDKIKNIRKKKQLKCKPLIFYGLEKLMRKDMLSNAASPPEAGGF